MTHSQVKEFHILNKKFIHFFSLIIIFSSWILFVLIFFGLDINSSLIDTDFLRKNNEGNLGKSLYSFPLGLGVFITGQNYATLGDLSFPQFCSFYIEPQIFCFNYFPLLFLYLNQKVEIVPKIIILFLSICISISAFSLTNIQSLYVFYFLF